MKNFLDCGEICDSAELDGFYALIQKLALKLGNRGTTTEVPTHPHVTNQRIVTARA
jgi:hypothetical protein